jgi:hypothetical protein
VLSSRVLLIGLHDINIIITQPHDGHTHREATSIPPATRHHGDQLLHDPPLTRRADHQIPPTISRNDALKLQAVSTENNAPAKSAANSLSNKLETVPPQCVGESKPRRLHIASQRIPHPGSHHLPMLPIYLHLANSRTPFCEGVLIPPSNNEASRTRFSRSNVPRLNTKQSKRLTSVEERSPQVYRSPQLVRCFHS